MKSEPPPGAGLPKNPPPGGGGGAGLPKVPPLLRAKRSPVLTVASVGMLGEAMVMSLSIGLLPASEASFDSTATEEVYLPVIWYSTPRRTASCLTDSLYLPGGWMSFTNLLSAPLAWLSQPRPSSSSRIARLAASEWTVVPSEVSESALLH